MLPVSYVFETRSFRLKGYSVLVGERPGLRAGGVWNQTCVFCHNTVPYFDALWGELRGPGAPGVPGRRSSIALLPRDRRWRFDGRPGTEAALRRRGRRRGRARSAGRRRARATIGAPRSAHGDPRAARRTSAPRHFVEVGIGCEACHGGSREHVARPARPPDFAPRSAFLHGAPGRGRRRRRAPSR